MLSAELVADARSMTALRTALDRLKYEVIKGSEYLQFARPSRYAVRQDRFADRAARRAQEHSRHPRGQSSRQARAADRPELHAHPTDGALTLSESPSVIEVTGTLSTDERSPRGSRFPIPSVPAYEAHRVPRPANDADTDLGRHHALDVFRIVAMLTEQERDQVQANVRHFAANAQVRSCVDWCARIRRLHRAGVLAMRAHTLWQNDQQLAAFLEPSRESCPDRRW